MNEDSKCSACLGTGKINNNVCLNCYGNGKENKYLYKAYKERMKKYKESLTKTFNEEDQFNG